MLEGGIRYWLDRFREPDRPALGRNWGPVLLVVAHVACSLPYLATLPPFNWPDEPAHFNYVRELAEGRGLDVMDRSSWAPAELERLKAEHFEGVDPTGPEIEPIRYEAHQPPLYYAIAAAVYRLGPRIEVLKLLNLALSCGVVILTWFAARRLFPETPLIWWASGLFSTLLPMRCFLAVSVGNGVAAELAFALFVLTLAHGFRPAAVGAVVGCGLWIHSALLLALPLYGGWLALSARSGAKRSNGASARPWRSFTIAAVVALVLWSPWLARNAAVYGNADPLALVTGALSSDEAVTDALGQARPRLTLTGPHGPAPFAYLLFNSFWGVFGWMEMFFGRSIQAFFALLSLAPLLGLAAAIRGHAKTPHARAEGRHLLWLGLTALLFLAAVVAYSRFDFQAQGRYLLTASTAFAMLYGAGLSRALGRAAGPWLALASLGLVAANLYGAFYVVPWYLAR